MYGIMTRKNAIAILMGIELILNSANINFIAFGRFNGMGGVDGQVFSMFVIILAAAEAAVELRCRGALHSSTPLRGRSLKQHEVTGGTRWRIVNEFISGLFEVRCGLHFLFVVANVCVF